MATAIARLEREKRLSTLARNLFVIEGRDKAVLQRRAERALLAANPRLAKADGFVSGATVIVPSVPGLKTTDRVRTPSTDLQGLLAEAALGLQTGASTLKDRFGGAQENDKQKLERLGDRSFTATVRKVVPDGAKLIGQSQKAIKQRSAEEAKRLATFEKAIGNAVAEIDKLQTLARPGGDTRPRPSRPDPTRKDPTRPDPTRPDPKKPDPKKPDPKKPDPKKPGSKKPDPKKPDPKKPDPTRPKPTRPRPRRRLRDRQG